MANDILVMMLRKNKSGTFSNNVNSVIQALLQLTVGLKSGYGTTQDNPECFIGIAGSAFTAIDENSMSSDIQQLVADIQKYVERYVTDKVTVTAEFVTVEDNVIYLTFNIEDDNANNPEEQISKFLYQVGYDETGVYTNVDKM